MFATAADRATLVRQLQRLVGMGAVPIAFYGAGRVLEMLRHKAGPEMARFDEHVVGVVDDNAARRGATHAGLVVMSPEEAIARGVRSVIITAEGAAQDALWAKRGMFVDVGVRVLCCPPRFAGQTWDEGLIERYEWTVARENGIEREYTREYPGKEERCHPDIVAAIGARMTGGEAVCEIGSGAGLWTARFIDRAREYHCVDYSARLLHEAIEPRFAKYRDRLRLHHDERAELPGVPDDGIDVVFSIDVFVHFKIDLTHQFLASIARVLRPSGVALLHFATWNADGIRRWEEHDTAHHHGGVGPIHPTHPDWLRASGERLGLTVKVVQKSGWTYLAEFSRRNGTGVNR
jgi:ubiquinone/menaquinone biosynthesis C-methylase UbiE